MLILEENEEINMYKVRNRDGKIIPFEIEKIKSAMIKAFEAEKVNYDENVIDFLALKVTAAFEPSIKNNIIDEEVIQDKVEFVLSQAGYSDIAKAYMGKSYYSGGGRRGMARRISWDEPSLTLTCSPSQKQTERCHPDETRPFTVREYARIQSFPDDWEFCGGIGDQYKQIGNALPVELARRICVQIKKALEDAED